MTRNPLQSFVYGFVRREGDFLKFRNPHLINDEERVGIPRNSMASHILIVVKVGKEVSNERMAPIPEIISNAESLCIVIPSANQIPQKSECPSSSGSNITQTVPTQTTVAPPTESVEEVLELKLLLKKIFCEVSMYRMEIQQELSQDELVQLYGSLCKLNLKQAQAYYAEFRQRYAQYSQGEVRASQLKQQATIRFKKSSGIIGKWQRSYDPQYMRSTRQGKEATSPSSAVKKSPNSSSGSGGGRNIKFAHKIEEVFHVENYNDIMVEESNNNTLLA